MSAIVTVALADGPTATDPLAVTVRITVSDPSTAASSIGTMASVADACPAGMVMLDGIVTKSAPLVAVPLLSKNTLRALDKSPPVRVKVTVPGSRPAWDASPSVAVALQRFSRNPGGFLSTTRVEYAAALLAMQRVADAKAVLASLAAHRSSPLSLLDRQVLVQLAAVDRLEGRPVRALERLREASAFTPESGSAQLTAVHARLHLGQLLLESRALDEAEQHLNEADTLRRAVQGVVTPIGAEILMSLGRVALARGDRVKARERFEAAHAFWQDFDATHSEAREAARWLSTTR